MCHEYHRCLSWISYISKISCVYIHYQIETEKIYWIDMLVGCTVWKLLMQGGGDLGMCFWGAIGCSVHVWTFCRWMFDLSLALLQNQADCEDQWPERLGIFKETCFLFKHIWLTFRCKRWNIWWYNMLYNIYLLLNDHGTSQWNMIMMLKW